MATDEEQSAQEREDEIAAAHWKRNAETPDPWAISAGIPGGHVKSEGEEV